MCVCFTLTRRTTVKNCTTPPTDGSGGVDEEGSVSKTLLRWWTRSIRGRRSDSVRTSLDGPGRSRRRRRS